MMKKTMGHEEKERAKADLVGVFMIDIESTTGSPEERRY